MKRTFFAWLALLLLGASPAFAQATATPVIPGSISPIGCGGTGTSTEPCFSPFGAANPLYVTGSLSATFSAGSIVTGQASLILVANSTSYNVALGSVGPVVAVYNPGAAVVNVKLSVGASTAAATDTPVAPGTYYILNTGGTATYLNAFTTTGAGTVLTITTGTGSPSGWGAANSGGGTVTQGTAAAAAGAWPTYLVQGTTANASGNPIFVQLTTGAAVLGSVSQNGTWNVTNISGTVSLPTGAATSAKQPALGTAGTPSADVISIQGVAGGIAQPITVASLPLPSGASTAAKQPALGTAGSPSTDVITVQGNASGTAIPVADTALLAAVQASIPAGAATIGATNSAALATGGVSTIAFTGGTGNALLTNSPTAVKASAGSLYKVAFINSLTANIFVQCFDLATGSVTLGTTAPKMVWIVPGGATGGAWTEDYNGEGRVAFSTAITCAATTTSIGATAPASGLTAIFNFK